MGGGLAGAGLAGAVAAAGGLGTLGLLPPRELREAIRQVQEVAPDRAVAVGVPARVVGTVDPGTGHPVYFPESESGPLEHHSVTDM